MPLSLFHLHGDLKDLRFPRLLAALREDDFTGVFQATTRPAAGGAPAEEAAEVTREVHFSGGHIAWAISTDREESLRAYVLRHRTLTEARWAEAEEKARDGTLRQALIGLGIVDARELTQIEKGRAEEIVQALFSARDGEYRVRERQLSPGTPDLKIDPRPLILKGVLEGGDRALVLDEVGSLDTVYVVKRPVLEVSGLNLPGEFQSVLRHIDGKRSIAQICSATSMPDNFVCSLFAALSMIGAIRRNYEKTQSRGRGEIVKGTEVAVTAVAPRAPAPPPRVMPPPPAAAIPQAAVEDVQKELPDPLPPISRTPFPGEGPVTTLASSDDLQSDDELQSDDDLEVDDELDGEEEAVLEPAIPPPVSAPMMADVEVPPEENSRPWFLLGGAAAVGAAALFLILMAQGPGDAGQALQPATEAASEAAPELPPGAPPGDVGGADSTADNPDEGDNTEGGQVTAPPPQQDSPRIATSSGTSIFNPARAGTGRESLASGDYLAAARYFGNEVSARAGQYTIQLLTACQDETIRRAVQGARGAADLFILSTRLEGRDCYRVYWGRYSSAARAREALRRDVPTSFLQERSQPRITRLGG